MEGDIPIMRDDIIEHYIDGGGLYKFGYELGNNCNSRLGVDGLKDQMGIYCEDGEQMVDDCHDVLIDNDCAEHEREPTESYDMEDGGTDTSSIHSDSDNEKESCMHGESDDGCDYNTSAELIIEEDNIEWMDARSNASGDESSAKSTDRSPEQDTNDGRGDLLLGDGWSALVPATTTTARRTKKQGTSASLADLLGAMKICQYSGANRYLCRNLVYIGTTRCASPLNGTKAHIPSVFVFRPMPMPNRAMDGIAMCLREDAITSGILKRVPTSRIGHDRVTSPFIHEELLQITFKAIVLRFTGRLLPHSLYAKSCGKKTWCPEIDDIDQYLAFMKTSILNTNENESLSQWLSEQHLHSIPLSTKNFSFFGRFLHELVLLLPAVVMQMMKDDNTREQAVKLLSDHLSSCCVSSNQDGNLPFLAQQIVADVEEIFDFPYGQVTARGMKSGSGSCQGFEMFRKGGLHSADFSTVLSTIVSYFEQNSNDDDLMVLGFRRAVEATPSSMLRNVVNGRSFNYTDAEHFLCKAWIIAKYTFPQNSASVQPQASKPHCHPIKMGGSGTFQLPYMTDIMNEIIDSFEAMSDRRYITPTFCLTAGETGLQEGKCNVDKRTDDLSEDEDDRKPAARVVND